MSNYLLIIITLVYLVGMPVKILFFPMSKDRVYAYSLVCTQDNSSCWAGINTGFLILPEKQEVVAEGLFGSRRFNDCSIFDKTLSYLSF